MTLSGWLGGQCRFYPTCSHYAEDAIRTHGAVKGTAMAVWRSLAGPFTDGGVDHVPPRRNRHAKYACHTGDDPVIGVAVWQWLLDGLGWVP